MDKLLFWLGIGAAQKTAGTNKRTDSRHWVISFVVGILIALLIGVATFLLLVSQQ
jgi:phosphatidylglycerophosphatase A